VEYANNNNNDDDNINDDDNNKDDDDDTISHLFDHTTRNKLTPWGNWCDYIRGIGKEGGYPHQLIPTY